jgi:hypothetical protein
VGTKEQVTTMFIKPLPREAFEYLCQRLRVISTPKCVILNAYLICIICTRGSTINRTVQVGRSDESVRGRNPEWKYTFGIDDKLGEIYQM